MGQDEIEVAMACSPCFLRLRECECELSTPAYRIYVLERERDDYVRVELLENTIISLVGPNLKILSQRVKVRIRY